MGVKWKELRRFVRRTDGFEARRDGGDVIVKGPNGRVHRIGHKFCSSNGAELSPAHLSALKRKFGINEDDIKNS